MDLSVPLVMYEKLHAWWSLVKYAEEKRDVGYYNSFIVKIWTDEHEGKVRGHILHVGSQESAHFLKLDKMLDFIMGHLTPPRVLCLEDGGKEEGIDSASLQFRETNDEIG